LRVLLLTPLFAPRVGGLEIFVGQLARQLVVKGHDVAIVTSHGDEAESGLDRVDGIPVLRIDAHRVMGERDVAGILRVQQQLARFAREFSAEVVHSHDVALVMWMYQRGARLDKAPLVVTLHNVMSRRSESALPAITKVLREATWTTGVSQAVVDDMLSYAPFVAATSSVIRKPSYVSATI